MQHSPAMGFHPATATDTSPASLAGDETAGLEQVRTRVSTSQSLAGDFALTIHTPVSAALATEIGAVINAPGVHVPNPALPHIVEAVGHSGRATFRISMEITGGAR